MKPKLAEIANRISAHLARFERDPDTNAVTKWGTTPYYVAHSWAAGRYVGIRYVSYGYPEFLTRAAAIRYLAWLDAGQVGKHYDAELEGT